MRLRSAPIPALALAALAAVAMPGGALAQSGGAYNLDWNTLTGGGQTFAEGGAYSVGGTTGQSDAGAHTGGAYSLSGGFWYGAAVPTTGAGPQQGAVPLVFATRLSGPNPFRGTTSIQFDLPSARHASVALFGVDGRLVRRLIEGERGAGRHTVFWDGSGADVRPAGPGIYFVKVRAGESHGTLRLVRIR